MHEQNGDPLVTIPLKAIKNLNTQLRMIELDAMYMYLQYSKCSIFIQLILLFSTRENLLLRVKT